MGVETAWQQQMARRLAVYRQQRALDDRGDARRRTARNMLIMALLLGLLAYYLSRSIAPPVSASGHAGRTVKVVAAAAEIGFGEAITPDKLKLIDWPAGALPKGSFSRIDELIGPNSRAALRPIAVNELLLGTALASGAARLSTAPLLAPGMRAVAVPVNEVSDVGGFVFPGDRVDVFITQQPDGAMPYAELIAQNIRVLAVGTDMNIGKDKPEVVHAATLEVTPLQGQKLTLAMMTGQISLALRQFSDDGRIRLESLQVSDLNDGTVTRLVRKPGSTQGAGSPARTPPAAPSGPGVMVIRGNEVTREAVLPSPDR